MACACTCTRYVNQDGGLTNQIFIYNESCFVPTHRLEAVSWYDELTAE